MRRKVARKLHDDHLLLGRNWRRRIHALVLLLLVHGLARILQLRRLGGSRMSVLGVIRRVAWGHLGRLSELWALVSKGALPVSRLPTGILHRANCGRNGAIHGVDCFELAVLHHGLENAGIKELGLFDDALDHLAVGRLELGSHKGDHGDVALELDVFAQVEAVGGGSQASQANLARLWRLDAGLVAADAILVAQVNVHGRIDVRLQAPGHVVEAAVELDLAGAHLAHSGDHLDALLDFVPGAVKLVGGGIARRWDGLVAQDKRVERQDFAVRVQNVDGQLSRDEAWDWRHQRKRLFLAKHFGHLI